MYKVLSKSVRNSGTSSVTTNINIQQQEPFVIINDEVEGDYSSASDSELISVVLEQFYKNTYPEKVSKETTTDIKADLEQVTER